MLYIRQQTKMDKKKKQQKTIEVYLKHLIYVCVEDESGDVLVSRR